MFSVRHYLKDKIDPQLLPRLHGMVISKIPTNHGLGHCGDGPLIQWAIDLLGAGPGGLYVYKISYISYGIMGAYKEIGCQILKVIKLDN